MMAFYDGVGDVLNRVIERSKKNLKEKRRKRNVAACRTSPNVGSAAR